MCPCACLKSEAGCSFGCECNYGRKIKDVQDEWCFHTALSFFRSSVLPSSLAASRTSPLVKNDEGRICHLYEWEVFSDEDFMRDALSLWYHGKVIVSDGNTIVLNHCCILIPYYIQQDYYGSNTCKYIECYHISQRRKHNLFIIANIPILVCVLLNPVCCV